MNKSNRILAVALTSLIMLSGCMTRELETTQMIRADGQNFLIIDPESEVVLLKNNTTTGKICRQPSPDAVGTSSQSFALGNSISSAKEASDVGAKVIDKADSSVVIARELFYRTCEFSLNYNLTKEEALKLFKETRMIISDLKKKQD